MKKCLLCIFFLGISWWQIFYGITNIDKSNVEAKETGSAFISLPNVPAFEGLTVSEDQHPNTCYGCHGPHILTNGSNQTDAGIIYGDDSPAYGFEKKFHHPMGIQAQEVNSPRAPGTDTWFNGQLICLSCHDKHRSDYAVSGDNNNYLRWDFKNDRAKFCLHCHSDKDALSLGPQNSGHHQLYSENPTDPPSMIQRKIQKNGVVVEVASGNCMFCHFIHDGDQTGREYISGPIHPEINTLMRVPALVLTRDWADYKTKRSDEPIYYEDMCYGCHGRESIVGGPGGAGARLKPDLFFSHRYVSEPDPNNNPCHNMGIKGANSRVTFPLGGAANHDDYGVPQGAMYCGSCHDVHNDSIPPYLNGKYPPFQAYSDPEQGFCQGCHQGNYRIDKASHPVYKAPKKDVTTELFFNPLEYDAGADIYQGIREGGSGEKGAVFDGMDTSGTTPILCLSCHNVHAGLTNYDGNKYRGWVNSTKNEDDGYHGALLIIDNNKKGREKDDLCNQCHPIGWTHPPFGKGLHVDDDYSDDEDTDGDNDFKHIQAAITAADYEVVIIVHPGTYLENINFLGKAITIESTAPSDPNVIADTIIDGGETGSVVTFNSGEGNDSVLSGVSVLKGKASQGGGIYCSSSSPTITNCIISTNSASSYAGGIYCRNNSAPIVSRCSIIGNSAPNGGGIYCLDSSPVISHCTISGNSGTNGGGIRCTISSPTITNCSISANSVSLYAGGIYCYSSTPIITNCTIAGNSASGGGGGIRCYNSSPILINCTIADNIAPNGGGFLCYCSTSTTAFPSIKNSILWNNLPNEISGAGPSITYSNIRGGDEGIGNIDVDPLFVDPNEGDYHLKSNSPCIDAGTGQDAPDTDKDSSPRPIKAGYDMGAYEFLACPQSSLITFYHDTDGDDYGNPNIIFFGCEKLPGFSENGDDCCDNDPNINPDAPEVCDFVDNNCNGSIDEGLALYTYYVDSDGDGYGAPDMSIEACKELPGYASNHIDCYDGDPNINPAKITIKTVKDSSLVNFALGRNLIKTLEPSCYPYTSFDLLSDFKEMGDILGFHYREPQSKTFKPTYWFFKRLSGKEINLSNTHFKAEAQNLYIIDKIE